MLLKPRTLIEKNVERGLFPGSQVLAQAAQAVHRDERGAIGKSGGSAPDLWDPIGIEMHHAAMGWSLLVFVQVVVGDSFRTGLRHDHEGILETKLDGLRTQRV